jgi:hypothetical protein
MRFLSNKISMLVLALLFSVLVITPNTQAQSVNRSPQGDNAAYKAFADTLTAEQFKSIEQILQKYKSELDAFIAESGQPNAAAASSVFLPLVQGGDSSQSSQAAAPALKRDFAVEKQAKRFAEAQQQIDAEIRSVLTADQASMFDAINSQSLPAESDSVQSANADINTTYCYYAYYYGYYANYYSYYAYLYAYYAYYYGNSTYAYYAYYYGYYAEYYAYLGYYYGYYCYYG